MSFLEFPMSDLDDLPFSDWALVSSHRQINDTGEQSVLYCGFLHKRTERDFFHKRCFTHYATVLLLDGSGTYRDAEGREHPLRPGDAFQRLPGIPHLLTGKQDGTWRECFIAIGESLFRALAAMGCLNATRPVLHPGLDRALVARLHALVHTLSRAAQPELPSLLPQALDILIRWHDLDRRQDFADPDGQLIQKACSMLCGDPAEEIPLPAIAARLGVDYERFRRVFRLRMGISPGAYRIRLRIQRACGLLTNQSLSIKEAASQLGYPDAFAFSKQFRAIMGCSPTDFRSAL